VDPDYDESTLKVFVNGVQIFPDADGKYRLTDLEDPSVITVEVLKKTYPITVTAPEGDGKLYYRVNSVTGDEEWILLTDDDKDADGNYVIPVKHGDKLEIKAENADGSPAVISDGLRREIGTILIPDVRGPISLSVTFSSPADDNNDIVPVIVVLALTMLALLTLILLLMRWSVKGTVTVNGKGLKGVTISYVADGASGSVVTGRNGKYAISAKKGVTVAITAVTMAGHAIDEIPEPIVMENRKMSLNMTMSEV